MNINLQVVGRAWRRVVEAIAAMPLVFVLTLSLCWACFNCHVRKARGKREEAPASELDDTLLAPRLVGARPRFEASS